MRRRVGVAVLAALLAMLSTGCGAPAGLDGELTDDWGPFPEPSSFVPAAGVCHRDSVPTGYILGYVPMDCAQTHLVETVYVGTLTGEHAARSTPPTPGSPAHRAAFTDCDAKATEFVGADWRGARLAVEVVPPSPQGWAGGSRWYRCDMFEINVLDGSTARKRRDNYAIQRAGSLRGVLTAPSPLGYGCFDEDRWKNLQPVACDKPHHFEYAGVWNAPFRSHGDLLAKEDRVHVGCRSVIAKYANIPEGSVRYRVGSTFRGPSEEWWTFGDRGVRCFLWSDKRALTRSVKGAGPGALPIG